MAEFGNYVIYLIMIGAVVGAFASVLKPESGLGKEFVNGIHSIGPVFLAQAGIMVAIPYLSKFIEVALGPYFGAMGSDVSIPRCPSLPWTWAGTSWPMLWRRTATCGLPQ